MREDSSLRSHVRCRGGFQTRPYKNFVLFVILVVSNFLALLLEKK
jgi:hypothetical protein